MKSTDEVKVGAVTLGGFVILALMLTFLGVFSFASRQYKLNVIFDNVNGLKVGNEVRFAGVPIGKVDDILVDGSKVKVVMKIDQKQKVPRNSQFGIGMDGVMGTKFVTITPPEIATGVTFREGETITGQTTGGVDKLMRRLLMPSATSLVIKLSRSPCGKVLSRPEKSQRTSMPLRRLWPRWPRITKVISMPWSAK